MTSNGCIIKKTEVNQPVKGMVLLVVMIWLSIILGFVLMWGDVLLLEASGMANVWQMKSKAVAAITLPVAQYNP